MKFHLEFGKVRWWLIASLAAAFVAGLGVGAFLASVGQTCQCQMKIDWPDGFLLPS